MGALPVMTGMTVEEYLAFEEQSEEKHEYYGGEVFAMAGAGFNHNVIAGNCIADIHLHLRGKNCIVTPGDLKIQIESMNLFTYPDISVICGTPQFFQNRKDSVTNPAVLIEVISPSTADYDHGKKFAFYRMIPSLKEYVLISATEILVEIYKKQSTFKWEFTEYRTLEESITIDAIGLTLQVADLYRNVDFNTHA